MLNTLLFSILLVVNLFASKLHHSNLMKFYCTYVHCYFSRLKYAWVANENLCNRNKMHKWLHLIVNDHIPVHDLSFKRIRF